MRGVRRETESGEREPTLGGGGPGLFAAMAAAGARPFPGHGRRHHLAVDRAHALPHPLHGRLLLVQGLVELGGVRLQRPQRPGLLGVGGAHHVPGGAAFAPATRLVGHRGPCGLHGGGVAQKLLRPPPELVARVHPAWRVGI